APQRLRLQHVFRTYCYLIIIKRSVLTVRVLCHASLRQGQYE
ncbi:unnamed protein product, partial [Amoebophrya sp. A25]